MFNRSIRSYKCGLQNQGYEEDQLKREGQELPTELNGTEAIVESSCCCDSFQIRFQSDFC